MDATGFQIPPPFGRWTHTHTHTKVPKLSTSRGKRRLRFSCLVLATRKRVPGAKIPDFDPSVTKRSSFHAAAAAAPPHLNGQKIEATDCRPEIHRLTLPSLFFLFKLQKKKLKYKFVFFFFVRSFTRKLISWLPNAFSYFHFIFRFRVWWIWKWCQYSIFKVKFN